MLFKSLILDKASGSVGGGTFSHNRFGQYIRQRSTPVNPNSQRQQDVRAVFSQLASNWSGILTQAQRDAWNLFGNSVEFINKVGDTIHLTGYNQFQRSNTAILQAGGARVDAGPTTFSLPETDPTIVATVSEGSQQISLVFDNTLAWANEDEGFLTLLMASPKGAGVDFIDGPFRFAGAVEGDSITPPTSPAVIDVPFGVAELQKSQVQARIVRADGRLSTPFRDTFVVAA